MNKMEFIENTVVEDLIVLLQEKVLNKLEVDVRSTGNERIQFIKHINTIAIEEKYVSIDTKVELFGEEFYGVDGIRDMLEIENSVGNLNSFLNCNKVEVREDFESLDLIEKIDYLCDLLMEKYVTHLENKINTNMLIELNNDYVPISLINRHKFNLVIDRLTGKPYLHTEGDDLHEIQKRASILLFEADLSEDLGLFDRIMKSFKKDGTMEAIVGELAYLHLVSKEEIYEYLETTYQTLEV